MCRRGSEYKGGRKSSWRSGPEGQEVFAALVFGGAARHAQPEGVVSSASSYKVLALAGLSVSLGSLIVGAVPSHTL